MSPGVPTQLTLDLWKRDRDLAVLAQHCAEVGIERSDVEVLQVLARGDQSRGPTSFGAATLREWGRKIGRDHKTAGKALHRLQSRGLALVEEPAEGIAGGVYAVLVDWSAVFALEPSGRDPAAVRQRLESRRAAGGDTVGTPGDTRATCSSKQESKSRVKRVRVPEHVERGDSVGTPTASGGAGGLLVDQFPPRPWARSGGLAEWVFVQAVRQRDKAALTRLYFAGEEAGFWSDCEAYRVRFLACCAAAVRCATTSAFGLAKGYVRANLRDRSTDTDVERRKHRLSQEDEDWARETRRLWNRPPEYDCRRAEEDAEVWR